MSFEVKGIVLGNVDVKEKDKLIWVYTLENGKITLSMKGVRQSKSKLKYAKDIFCFGTFLCEKGKGIDIVTGVDLIDNFENIRNNIDKYYEGCAILDLIKKIGADANPPLFIELVKALKTLCYDDVKKFYVINKFLLTITNALGYNFLSYNCSACKLKLNMRYLNLDIGEIVCPACKTFASIPISDLCYSALKILSGCEYEKIHTIKIGGSGAYEAFLLLSKNLYHRTGIEILKIS